MRTPLKDAMTLLATATVLLLEAGTKMRDKRIVNNQFFFLTDFLCRLSSRESQEGENKSKSQNFKREWIFDRRLKPSTLSVLVFNVFSLSIFVVE